MEGIDLILDNIKKMMEELFDECREVKGVMRSHVKDLGVTGVDALFEVVMEYGFDPQMPYPIVHFMVTLAKDIDERDGGRISVALNELNHVIAVGDYPSFGAFCYYPRLRQIFLSYRLPVNPAAAEAEVSNIRYYMATLYRQLDIFADFIMFICDTQGQTMELADYMNYLSSVEDIDDIQERTKALEEYLNRLESENDKNNN